MHYYLDGYNLMFRILRAGGNLSDKRNQIVKEIHQRSALLSLNVTLVFDSQYQPNEFGKSHFHNLEIIFSDYGETADERILKELKNVKQPHLYTVVTSDKKLAWLARRRHLKTETVEEFFQWLNQRFRNRLKELKNPPEPPKKVLEKVAKTLVIQESTSAEDCYSYYLNYFQKEYERLEEESGSQKSLKREKRKGTKRNKKNSPEFKETREEVSDLWEYWLKSFEDPMEE